MNIDNATSADFTAIDEIAIAAFEASPLGHNIEVYPVPSLYDDGDVVISLVCGQDRQLL